MQYDNQYKEQMKSIEKKYEKHLNEQLIVINKLKRQNEDLLNKKNARAKSDIFKRYHIKKYK